MCKKLEIELREQNYFQDNHFFFKILISICRVNVKLRIKTKKYADDSAIQFPTKSILRRLTFTETIRQLVSKPFISVTI